MITPEKHRKQMKVLSRNIILYSIFEQFAVKQLNQLITNFKKEYILIGTTES